jgi:hypothetical protein
MSAVTYGGGCLGSSRRAASATGVSGPVAVRRDNKLAKTLGLLRGGMRWTPCWLQRSVTLGGVEP